MRVQARRQNQFDVGVQGKRAWIADRRAYRWSSRHLFPDPLLRYRLRPRPRRGRADSAPQEFEQLGELARSLSAHRLDVAAVPVVETFARRKPGSAEGDHRLEHGIGGRIVEQLRHDRLLGVGMDLEAADVLLLDKPV